jgi:hypothetical protein
MWDFCSYLLWGEELCFEVCGRMGAPPTLSVPHGVLSGFPTIHHDGKLGVPGLNRRPCFSLVEERVVV